MAFVPVTGTVAGGVFAYLKEPEDKQQRFRNSGDEWQPVSAGDAVTECLGKIG